MNTPFLQFFLSSVKTPIFWESGGGGDRIQNQIPAFGRIANFIFGAGSNTKPGFWTCPGFLLCSSSKLKTGFLVNSRFPFPDRVRSQKLCAVCGDHPKRGF